MGKRFRQLTQTATDADFAEGNYFGVDTPSVTKKVPVNLIAKQSSVAALQTKMGNISASIAPEYNGTTGAVAGRLYMHEGSLYRCIENTIGDFDSSKFDEVPASDAFFDKGAQKKSFGEFQVKDVPVLDQNGNQANVNLFKQVVQIPKSKKQWFNKNGAFLADGYIGSGTFTANSNFKTAIVKLLSGVAYRVSIADSASRFSIAAYQDIPSNGDTTTVKNESVVSGSYSRKYMDITLPEGYCYLCIYFYARSFDGDDYAPLLNTIMVGNVSEGENDFQAFELDRISLDNVAEKKEAYTPSYGMLKKMLSDSVLNPQNVTDVTSSFNLGYTSGKYLKTNHDEAVSSVNSISNYIAVDLDNLYFCYLKNTVPNCCGIVYYDAGGAVLEDVHCGSPATDFAFSIVPPAGAATFRICSEASNSKVYKVTNRNLSLMLESKLMAATSGLAISEGDDVTSSYPLNTGAHYRIDSHGRLASASIGYVTNVIPITDWSKTLLLRSKIDQYGTCCVFYKDAEGNVVDSVAPLADGSTSVTYRVVFPITAKAFRLGTRTIDDYSVNEFTYVGGGDTQAIESRLSEVESDVAGLENSVAELEESAMLSQVIDTVEAVKYRQKRVLYLGANIFDFASLVYDSTYWSVDAENGTISYLGGSLDPVELDVSLDNNASYVFECTTSDYVTQTNMFDLSIGDVPKSDPYNGTDSIFAGMYSDGGKLKIYPHSTTNTFTLSAITVKKKVSQGAAQETVEYNCLEVNSGNGEFGALTAMWNVAIGPTPYTQPVKLSLTRSIAIGYYAQRNLLGGWQDIAIGTFAMNLLKFGNRNIALGCDCLYAVTHADDCIAIGKAAMSGIASQVNWNDPSTWQHILNWVSIGTASSKIANGQSASDSVYIGFNAGSDVVGSQNTVVGAKAKSGSHTNVVAVGYQAQADKNNQAVIGNSSTVETKVYGDLVVRGTDNVLRKIVFNNDNTCSWVVVS